MRKRDKFLIILLITGPVLCLVIVLAIGLSGEQKKREWAEMPAIPVTFDTIASHEGDKVSIEGVIVVGNGFPGVKECGCKECNQKNENYRSCFRLPIMTQEGYDPTDPNVHLDLYDTTESQKEPNHFDLPMFFEDASQFRIYTNDGQELTHDDPIRAIGFVCNVIEHNGVVDVYMCVMAIEAVK